MPIPILSFEKEFLQEDDFRQTLRYQVPEYFGKYEELITCPKNGILPINRIVKFRIKQEAFNRVFLIFFYENEERKEIFMNEETGYFERFLNIQQARMLIVGEVKENLELKALARYKGIPFAHENFDKINQNWFTYYSDQDLLEENKPDLI